jgi:DNA-binding NarL/FixJ family response regulator
MSRRRVLVAGGTTSARQRVTTAIDEAFDVDIDEQADVLAALKVLPNRALDLVVVLSAPGVVPALDLVRFLGTHPRHAEVPVLVCVADDTERSDAMALGAAAVLSAEPGSNEVQAAVRQALGLR